MEETVGEISRILDVDEGGYEADKSVGSLEDGTG
jgi:hypothetical protein